MALALAVGVERAGERGTEAGEMRTAVDRVDVVDVGMDVVGELARVLQSDFDADVVDSFERVMARGFEFPSA